MRVRNGVIEFVLVQGGQFAKDLLVNPVQSRPSFRLRRIFGRIRIRNRVRPEEWYELLRDEKGIFDSRASQPPQSQAVFGTCQVADLPTDMADIAGRHSEPVLGRCLVQKTDRVVAGEDNLVDGKA